MLNFICLVVMWSHHGIWNNHCQLKWENCNLFQIIYEVVKQHRSQYTIPVGLQFSQWKLTMHSYTVGSRWLQNGLAAGQSWTHQPSWWFFCENIFKIGQKIPGGGRRREQEEWETIKGTKVREGGAEGDDPGTGACFLQALGGPTPEMIFLTGTANHGEPTLEQRKSMSRK